ncbi:RagB/SusD family nutrient uptake outer membrane protein [Chitinophaga sp. RCC_12]|uniref:RagB/SusD family nutrient uptake outer membrane protein n=1 Tax=Chitinophaga sp. RCC_12 TaxID=3239226 RepID=UPI003526B772
MKRLIYIALPAALLLGSCSKDFIKGDVPAKTDVNQFYSNAKEVNMGLMDAYDAFQEEESQLARFVYGDMASDDALKGGETIGDGPDMEALVECRPLSTNDWSYKLWTQCYKAVTKANILVESIDTKADFKGDETTKNRYRAEAQFLRALGYYYLAMAYGDVPLFTNGVTNYTQVDPKMMIRKPVADVWAQVEKDLKEAIPALYTKQTIPSSELGRATKGAAQAILAKSLMFQKKYDAAVPVLSDLVKNGGYQLAPTFNSLWRPGTGDFNAENIFEINYTNTWNWSSDGEGAIRNVYESSRNTWGWGFNQPTQDLANEFEAGDPRIIYTLTYSKDIFQAKTPAEQVEEKNSINNVYQYHSYKVMMLQAERDGMTTGGAGMNEKIVRLADMYLLYAEALVRSTAAKDVNTAVFYLNEIRKRANNTPKADPVRVKQQFTVAANTLPMRVYTSDVQLLKDIAHERRVELGMEGVRLWDLIRTDNTVALDAYYKKWGANGYEARGDLKGKFYGTWISKFAGGKYPTFPIPQKEIDLSQGNLKQTSGY